MCVHEHAHHKTMFVFLAALLFFLTGLATLHTKVRRFSFAWNLVSEAILLSMFSCKEPWGIIALLALGTIPPYLELRERGITHLLFMGVTTEVCVQTSMREANDRGYECLIVEDGTESYFPSYKVATLSMLTAQGAIVGWSATTAEIQQALQG